MTRDKKLQKKKMSRKSGESLMGKRARMGQSPRDDLDRMATKDRNPRIQSELGEYPSRTLHQWGTSAVESKGECHPG